MKFLPLWKNINIIDISYFHAKNCFYTWKIHWYLFNVQKESLQKGTGTCSMRIIRYWIICFLRRGWSLFSRSFKWCRRFLYGRIMATFWYDVQSFGCHIPPFCTSWLTACRSANEGSENMSALDTPKIVQLHYVSHQVTDHKFKTSISNAPFCFWNI